MAIGDKLFVADKPTLDAVKVKTDLIGSANPAVGGTGDLFSYLKKLEGNGLLGFFENGLSAESTNYKTDSWQTLVNVSGKGVVTDVNNYVYFVTAADWKLGLRIWIDGIKIYGVYGSSASVSIGNYPLKMGFYSSKNLTYRSATFDSVTISPVHIPTLPRLFSTFPHVYESIALGAPLNHLVISDYPLTFNNSLKVEFYLYSLGAPEDLSPNVVCKYYLK